MRAILSLSILLLGVQSVQAQVDTYLQGVTIAHFWVQPLLGNESAHEVECGVSPRALRETLMLPIRSYTKMREPAPGQFENYPAVILKVKAVKAGNVCAYSIALDVLQAGQVKLNSPVERGFNVILFRDDTLVTSAASDNGHYMMGRVEEMVKKLATAWQGANP